MCKRAFSAGAQAQAHAHAFCCGVVATWGFLRVLLIWFAIIYPKHLPVHRWLWGVILLEVSAKG